MRNRDRDREGRSCGEGQASGGGRQAKADHRSDESAESGYATSTVACRLQDLSLVILSLAR